jgi:membrane-bound lytic murein transglycosylase A
MSKLQKNLAALSLLCLAACSSPPPLLPSPSVLSRPASAAVSGARGLSFSPLPVSALPDWPQQQLAGTVSALRQSCRKLASRAAWDVACQELGRLDTADNSAMRRFFEARFTAWKMRSDAGDSGLITGYFEPLLNGSHERSARTPFPVYGVPSDLLTFKLPPGARSAGQVVARPQAGNRLAWVPGATDAAPGQVSVTLSDFPAGDTLKGRVENGRLLPYYARADIARGQGVEHARVLAWVDDAVALFFMQVQGSGRIQMDDGSVLRLGVGDTNGYGYQSIGGWLAARGELSRSALSMQGIQAWTQAHPERQQELFNANPRYVFFKPQPEGPLGALGVPLTEGYSIAVDPLFIPLGSAVYLATTWPMSAQPLTRLVSAQDSGNDIRGPLRADFFWGYGAQAGSYAGKMKQNGSMWLLLPNGVQPAL